jgi:hypothetical protein
VPVRFVERPDKIGGRLADREGADNGADCEPTGGLEPGGDHLHCGRVNACEEESGEESADERLFEPGHGDQKRVRGRTEESGDSEVSSRGKDVREVEYRRCRCADYEPDLNDGGQPPDLTRV